MFKKKLLVLLMMSLSGSAFAAFNPFDVFNASNNPQQSSGQVPQGNQAAPVQNMPVSVPAPGASAPVASSPYVQASPLVVPATGKNAQLVAPASQKFEAPANPSVSKAVANTMVAPTRASQPSPANHFTSGPGFAPTSSASSAAGAASGNSAPSVVGLGSIANSSNNNSQPPVIGGDSILKVLNTINSNMVTWKTQSDQNKVGAGAQLIPTTTQNLQGFLLTQSGLSSFLNVPLIMNSVASTQKQYVRESLAAQSSSKNSVLMLLTPVTQNDVPRVLSKTSVSQDVVNDQYIGYFAQRLSDLAPATGVGSPAGIQIYSLIRYALAQVASQTKLVVSGSDSLMSTLQSSVNAPFATQSQSNGATTWLQQLQTASSPQVLRTIAILLAESNQMRYIQLQNQQTMMVLQTAQVAGVYAENARLMELTQAQTQTNDLLLKMYAQLIAINAKK